MNIESIVSTDYEELPATATVSTLVGIFDDPAVPGVVVTDDDGYSGVVTRRQLTSSHHQPSQRVRSLVWHVPRVAPETDVREVAGLMLASDSRLLPVFEGDALVGVVTADDVLGAVQEFLGVASVADVASTDLVTVGPDDTFGETLHTFRDHGFTHLPVVEDGSAVGILSLYDVTALTTRAVERSQGGDAGDRSGRGHGGYGAREGERERLLDLPVRDIMVSPVETVSPDARLDTAVQRMFDAEVSSLVVPSNGNPVGIVTKSDVLEALTWETENTRAVQVTGMDLMDDATYEDVVTLVDDLDARDAKVTVFDAKLHLHEHKETQRGVPLLLARLRLYTDRGTFVASGEGYGATQAINEVRDVMERQLRDAKADDRPRTRPDADYWERRFGWLLEE